MFKFFLFIFLNVLILQLCIAFRVQCKNAYKIREDHIHNCCKHPDGHNDITEECARETGFRLFAPDEEAMEDVTNPQVMDNMCWGKCVFDKLKFMKNDDIDMKAVRLHYKSWHKTDPEYEKEMLNAFGKCHGESEIALAKFLDLPLIRALKVGKCCDPKPTVILACVITKFYHNCPRARWSNTTECLETRAFAKKCKDALTTMRRR